MRNIYIVNAAQVVTSDAHPEGLMSECIGAFQDMTQPEPEPEPEEGGDEE